MKKLTLTQIEQQLLDKAIISKNSKLPNNFSSRDEWFIYLAQTLLDISPDRMDLTGYEKPTEIKQQVYEIEQVEETLDIPDVYAYVKQQLRESQLGIEIFNSGDLERLQQIKGKSSAQLTALEKYSVLEILEIIQDKTN
jgi:hypothetical protein